jgi:uncharacterized protein YndB with AHSA1/START domain
MQETSFVYAIYIAASLEREWTALTSGAFTRQYWFDRRLESDWKIGAPVRFFDGSSDRLADDGVVLEYEPYRRMAYTFQPAADDESGQRPGASRVTLTLEEVRGAIKLVVQHTEIPNAAVHASVSNGWVMILSSLKSMLETSKPL